MDHLKFLAGYVYRSTYEPGSVTEEDREILAAIATAPEPEPAKEKTKTERKSQ